MSDRLYPHDKNRFRVRLAGMIAMLMLLFSCSQSGRLPVESVGTARSNVDKEIGVDANPISIVSWNLKDFGKSKSDDEIEFIAETVRSFDVIAIQEVVAGYGGPQAVAKLVSALNRTGSKWDYLLSDPTSSINGHSRERYAFIWKPSKIKKVGDGWLEKKYHREIEREPFLLEFSSNGKNFTLVNFHAVAKSKQPATEIKYFKFFPELYKDHNLIFAGDFNLPQSHSVYKPLRSLGFSSALIGQKTSLRQECLDNDCLASEYDNFFFLESKFRTGKAGIIHFYESFPSLAEARSISDHVPIFYSFSLN